MIETHPFGNFVPKNAQYLLLGSFVARKVDGYEWFYDNKRNHFWPIIETVYNLKLPTKEEKQALFTRLGIAVTDIILQCERKANNNADTSLTNMVFNTKAISEIIRENKVKIIFFSSRFVETLFRKHFKDIIGQHSEIKLITLPSPSPRYAIMTKTEKVTRYKDLLPKLE